MHHSGVHSQHAGGWPASDRRPGTIPLRCALYARHSTDPQRAASIEDPFRICREHAEREDWRIENMYRDAAIQGASGILPPGAPASLEGARRGLFEVVVAAALDRVRRDQADVAVLCRQLAR